MIKVQSFENQLMSSVCYVVFDDVSKKCVIVDPGSEKSLNEIGFIESNSLIPNYIILTHEHTDHNWGVNSLLEKYQGLNLVCSELCDKMLKKTNRLFFSYYNDNPNYVYTIEPADVLIKTNDDVISWNGKNIHFILTPGHSKASMCIDINGMLFTGDTIMPFPPYFNKKDGNVDDWRESIDTVISKYGVHTMIYPGHGHKLTLEEWLKDNKWTCI